MKIVMVHPHDLWYDPWTVRIFELARGLQQRGHEIHLCHLPRREKPKHAPLRLPRDGDPPIYELKPRQQNVWHNYKLLNQLAQNADVLHLQKCFAAASLPLLWTARRQKKTLHYDWDDNETAIAQKVEKRFWSRYQLAVYERNLPQFAATLTYSSQALHGRALKLGFPEDCMRHLPVGANTGRFAPNVDCEWVYERYHLDPNKLTVLYIGQLEGAAHAERLIEAAPSVLQQHSKTQFLFAGGGEQLEDLMRRAHTSPASRSINILGYIPAHEIPALVAAADICVACFEDDEASRAKSPLKIAEYLAAGKPVVASHVGDAPWMVQGCGITVKPGSTEALAQGILQYINDPQRRDTDGKAARERALNYFNWEHGVDVLEELFHQFHHDQV